MNRIIKSAVSLVAVVVSVFSMPAFGATVNGVFGIGSAEIVDLYSATFDGAIDPSCVGAPDLDECAFFGGQTTAMRNIIVTSSPATDATGTLDVDYDDATGAILTINSMRLNMPDAVLTIQGTTIVTVTQGNGVPVADDTFFIESGTGAPNGTADANEAVALGPSVFEHDAAPNTDAPDFAAFNDIVDSCSGPLCALIGILTLDGVRYRVLGTVNGTGGDSFQLQAQTGGHSVYKVNFSTVPIPATVWLFGSALGLLGWMRRKSK